MLRTFHFCLPILWLIFSFPVKAGVIERDWKVAGDGLLTFDDVNQREWLDLSETLLEQLPGTTLEDKYQSVVAETNAGGLFEGFTVPKSDDAFALAESSGIDISTFDYETNQIATRALMNLLGPTLVHTPDIMLSFGFLEAFSTFPPNRGMREAVIIFLDKPTPFNAGTARFLIGGDDSMSTSTLGVMLYRVAIPEPTSLILLAIAAGTVAGAFRSFY